MKRTTILIILLLTCSPGFPQKNPGYFSAVYGKKYDLLLNTFFPSLELEDENGNTFSTALLQGKTVYIDFWFTLCPPCIAEIPYAKALRSFFASDTNVVFLNICIENIERKEAWKKMVQEKEIKGINVFYARNRPQKVNLLRELKVNDFPAYLIANKQLNIIGYDAPRPSEKYWVQWAITQAEKNVRLSESYNQMITNEVYFKNFIKDHGKVIDSLQAGIK